MTPGRAFAIVTGGGTGGHVQPALAIAEALVERGHPRSSVHFVGCRHGMEGRLVPEAGFQITLLPGRGIQRRLTTENIGAAAGLTAACAMAVREVHRRRPRVVITVGGYAGFPSSVAALAERVPVVVVSYDSVPGAVNRFVGRFAAANAVAYPGTTLPRAEVTGPPVRAEVAAVDRSPEGRRRARAALGLDDERLLVLSTGGSQGARTINTATVEWCRSWRDRRHVAVHHVAGERFLEDVRRAAAAAGLLEPGTGLDYRLVGYEKSMPVLLAACDLVVARAGASTVAELTAVGVPSILVPLPNAPADHQSRNAAALETAGASLVVPDADCSGERLGEVVGMLLSDEGRRHEMAGAARRLGHHGAAARVAEMAESRREPDVIDLATPGRIHVVGVGGAGMSAIATVLSAMGHAVTGSDIKLSPSFVRLRTAGLPVSIGHDAANVAGVSGVAVSSAIPPTNVEVLEAARLGIPVWSRADVLASIATLRRTIAVAGTHGKTTTSSMLALILVTAGMRPSFIIGGDLNDIGTNAVWDEGEWLVVEADESDGTFLRLEPELAVVTSVEPDHLEHYGSFAALRQSFGDFMAAAGTCVVSADEPGAAELAPAGAVTFGQRPSARIHLGPITGGRSDAAFSLDESGERIGEFAIAVPGEHNARNAAAAVVAARVIGVRVDVIVRALARFAGVSRRFEFRGERNGVVFVDDYAHLPGETRAALAAAKRGGFSRVVCVFQPHRYSRIASLAPDFAGAFDDADVLFVTEIYNSGEAPRPGVTGRLIVDAVLRRNPAKRAEFVPIHSELLARLQATLRPGDCCLILEAGDLTGLPDELLELGGY